MKIGYSNQEEVARELEGMVNSFACDAKNAVEIGGHLRTAHRTLQRSIVVLCIGILVGLADQTSSDLRNATAIETAKKIKTLSEEGQLPYGPFV